MKNFLCPNCKSVASFANTQCTCGTSLVFDDRALHFVESETVCANRQLIGCNWLPPENGSLCRACGMTDVTPDAGTADNLRLWTESERAKRWVLVGLARWGWFTASDTGPVPRFHLLSENTATGSTNVTMGHQSGLITFNVAEADAATRVYRRELLEERLRTVIGHFRHEIAHFLFDRLMAERPGFADSFRAAFGDEREDYTQALQRHYQFGAPGNWSAMYVTPYASSHPHEDWAETAAHILHITDMVDSFAAAGLCSPSLGDTSFDAYAEQSSERLVTLGVELGIGLNHVNRSMGLPDIYPFVLTPQIREKLYAAHFWLGRDHSHQAQGMAN